MASTQQRMEAMQNVLDGHLGKPANVMIRNGERWVQHRGHIKGSSFEAQYQHQMSVPPRHDCHPRSKFSMELFGAWIIEESKNPSQEGAPEDTVIQSFDLGDDDTILIICNSKGVPALQGTVGEWRTEAEIVESCVEVQAEENARQ